jgi:hypothetical protein
VWLRPFKFLLRHDCFSFLTKLNVIRFDDSS